MKFGPRFSVRTLAIVVALACAYFGAWEATKALAIRDMVRAAMECYPNDDLLKLMTQDELIDEITREGATVPMPFVVGTPTKYPHDKTVTYDYYIWFFGIFTEEPICSF